MRPTVSGSKSNQLSLFNDRDAMRMRRHTQWTRREFVCESISGLRLCSLDQSGEWPAQRRTRREEAQVASSSGKVARDGELLGVSKVAGFCAATVTRGQRPDDSGARQKGKNRATRLLGTATERPVRPHVVSQVACLGVDEVDGGGMESGGDGVCEAAFSRQGKGSADVTRLFDEKGETTARGVQWTDLTATSARSKTVVGRVLEMLSIGSCSRC